MKPIHRSAGVSAAAIIVGVGLAWASGARADQVIPDDLIVQGSTCVGLDCVNNESFGFSTVILKENNTRLLFLDTSTSPGFAANSWQLVANDNATGGASFFSIDDFTAGRSILKVTAGARANSLFVSSASNVGLGTATPSLLLHMLKNDTPAIRFDQDNTGGFTAQIWDIGANEANFFVRDTTGGSRLPFRIRPGAPTSSVDIAASGFVGIGTASPAANLHVKSATNPTIELESGAAGTPKWTMSVAGTGGLFALKDLVSGNAPLKIAAAAPTNSIFIRADGSLQFAGLPNCLHGIRTSATGVASCAPASIKDRQEIAGGGAATTLASYNTSSTAAGDAESGTSSSNNADNREAPAGCSDGDIAGSWSMFGTNIEEGSANSVLWCDVQFSKSGKGAKYSIEGVCRSHATNAAIPQNYAVSGDRSISVTPACKFSGNFSLKQGKAAAVTATILEGRIEGEGASKTRAVGLSRWPRGKNFALQTFTMQR